MPSVSEKVNILERTLAEYVRNVGDAQMQTEKALMNLSNAQMQTEISLKNLSNAQMQTEKALTNLSNTQMQTEKVLTNLSNAQIQTEKELRHLGNTQMQTEKILVNLSNVQIQTEKEMGNLSIQTEKFKEEMKVDRESFKKEMLEDRKKMFKQWGDIANKMGTLAEDIVAPSIREIGHKYFDCEEDSDEDFMVRRFRRKTKDRGKRREFDVIAVYEDKVILVEVKSTPRMQYIDEFVATLKEFREYFPEYSNRKIISVFASLYLPDEVIAYLTKNGIYAMATRDDMMDLMNFGEVA